MGHLNALAVSINYRTEYQNIWNCWDVVRKHAKGEGCPTRPVADVKGKTGKMTVGGSLGYLKLSSRACVAVNPKRIELAMLQWNKKPIDLNRQALNFISDSLAVIDCIISHYNWVTSVHAARNSADNWDQCGQCSLDHRWVQGHAPIIFRFRANHIASVEHFNQNVNHQLALSLNFDSEIEADLSLSLTLNSAFDLFLMMRLSLKSMSEFELAWMSFRAMSASDSSWLELRVAAACLPCYWLKDEEHIIYWLADSLTDVVFCLSPQGTGADFLLKKFSNLAELVWNSDHIIHVNISWKYEMWRTNWLAAWRIV